MAEINHDVLARIHYLRMKAHWGAKWATENAFKDGRWPLTEKEWRQTPHGASWDTNVEMAKFQYNLSREINEEGLLHEQAR
jgi:hypothetical protein